MNGILLVDKPKGWTSFDVVAKVRGILREAQKKELLGVSHSDAALGSNENRAKRTGKYGERDSQAADAAMRREPVGTASSAGRQGVAVRKIRVGHTGTLDPQATGLLVLVLGSYTKRAGEFSKLDKVYEVSMKLGESSTTGDEEGEKSHVSDKKPTPEAMQAALRGFIGEIDQIPPQFSAIKVNGQRAYKLARAGKEVKLEPRKVKIHEIADASYEYPEVTFTAKVSTGTYIRSLVEDIGVKLGTGAYMSDLRRIQVGQFSVSGAPKVEDLDIQRIQNCIQTIA